MRGILVLCSLLCACAAPPPAEPAPVPWPLDGTVFRLSGHAPDFRGDFRGDYRVALREERQLRDHRNLFWGRNRDLSLIQTRIYWDTEKVTW